MLMAAVFEKSFGEQNLFPCSCGIGKMSRKNSRKKERNRIHDLLDQKPKPKENKTPAEQDQAKLLQGS